MNAFIPHFFWEIVQKNHILWGNIHTYEFYISDTEGNLLRKIVKDYDPVKTPNYAEENWQEEINWDYIPPFVNAQVKRPENYPPFLTFGVDEKGRMIVRTFERDREGQILYDIFDPEGRFLAKVSLGIPPLEPRRFVWKNKRQYAIESDEDGYQVIKCYRVFWNKL